MLNHFTFSVLLLALFSRDIIGKSWTAQSENLGHSNSLPSLSTDIWNGIENNCFSGSLKSRAVCYGVSGITLIILVVFVLLCVCCCKCIHRKHLKRLALRTWNNVRPADGEERMPLLPKNRSSRCCSNYVSLWTYLKSRYKWWRHQHNSDLEVQPTEQFIVRTEARLTQAELEEERAKELSQTFFKFTTFSKKLKDIGSRLQKYWYLRNNRLYLQFTAKKSTKLPFRLHDRNFVALKSLLQTLSSSMYLEDKMGKHPHLLIIEDINFEEDYLSVLMENVAVGSLRDIIYQAEPTDDWVEKYTLEKRRKTFTVEEIQTCGSHVLQAVNYLYRLKIPAIGQIHCGNVFCKDRVYYLAGYENVFLGYKTSAYSCISKEGLLSHIDLIMFGHMLYEMHTGNPPTAVLLEAAHFNAIKDVDLKNVLVYIFSKRLRRKKNPMKVLLDHKFFNQIPVQETPQVRLSEEARKLLEIILANITGRRGSDRKLKGGHDSRIFQRVMEKLDTYVQPQQYHRLGWRITKVWGDVKSKKTRKFGLLTITSVPSTCPIYVKDNMKVLEKLLKLEHPHLHKIVEAHCMKIDNSHFFVTFQDIVDEGSLKHRILRCRPMTEWKKQRHGDGTAIPADEVSDIGGQLLEAIMCLIHLDGNSEPLTLGCIHTGNIFKKGGTWRLAGFENTLLGLKCRQYHMFEEHKSNLDVLMFGHVIYEMATGKELEKVFPSAKDYKKVPKELLSLLKFIFEEEPGFDEIFYTFYLTRTSPSITSDNIGEEEKLVLKKVRKGKYRNQNDKMVKVKSSFQSQARNFRRLPVALSRTIATRV